ncbi:MAG: hypothetical protein ACFE75_11485, partial [Candidatus Hodarchaeota archaeon]
MTRKDLKISRLINQTEEVIIKNSLSDISLNIFTFLKKNNYFLYLIINDLELNEGYPSIYLTTNNLKELFESFKPQTQINSMGIYFGFLKKGRFF